MDKQSETEIRARISEADWALSNLELLKGTTFQAGVMWQNQVQRIRLLYDMLGEFEKTEATDLSNPTEPKVELHEVTELVDENYEELLDVTDVKERGEAQGELRASSTTSTPELELEEQLYKIFNNLWANRTNPNISRSDAYKHARQDVTKLIATQAKLAYLEGRMQENTMGRSYVSGIWHGKEDPEKAHKAMERRFDGFNEELKEIV